MHFGPDHGIPVSYTHLYSPGLKKLGAEFGLTAGKGRVYGLLEGFPVSMWDGAGTKNMLIYLGEPRDAAEDAQTDLQALLPRELEAYRIMQYELVDDLPLLLVCLLYTSRCV